MYLIRLTEETIAEKYSEGQMRCPTHLSIGQESVPVIVGDLIRKDDFAISTHRGHAHYLAKGGNLNAMIAEIYGKEKGCSKGKGGSMHLVDLSVNFMGTSAIVGNSIPVGVGLALSVELKEQSRLSVIYLGDGAIEEGVFFESANFAAVRNLNVLFVCENNKFSVYSPTKCRQPHDRKIVDLAASIGLKSFETSGYDLQHCYQVMSSAIQHVRNGDGPAFVEAHTYRFLEHCGPNPDDHLNYRSGEEHQEWLERDPLIVLRSFIVSNFQDGTELIAEIQAKIECQVKSAFKNAKNAAFPEPKSAFSGVYSKAPNNA